ncbi:signal transduction histidine kinase [Winogradskyella epiphytica]|uniref:histidine kinase n=1 Tax=Winogradskyella epiphytica TaxID=262005 RepID=A0A2V4X9M1_9FLAO|nr:HAMP domain-containing sensor histidine kinase [Winogradskyella epiphytica]PYE82755.1 signal transduction histidine kinase [Winogradskyella epiphytica]
MKLLNHTSRHLSVLLLPLITLWAFAFYYAMLDEIYDSLDDGLENQKVLLLKRLKKEPSIVENSDFDKHVYTFDPINKEIYDNFKESYHDTLMYMYNEEDFEPVRVHESAIEHHNNYYKLKIITSMVEVDDLAQDLIKYLIGLYILLVVSLLLLNNFILKKIWKPFYHSIGQLKNFKIEKENKITTLPTHIDEFKLLNETISKLIKKSSDSYIEQKQFIENASHELQTPLAISINKLELFIENNPLDEEQTKSLASILDNLDRLTRLNKSLLLLSKIENKQFLDEESVDFLELTETIIHDFEDLLAHKGMGINFESNSAPKIKMNKDLAIILLTNFIKNAIVHGQPNSEIHISLDNNLWSITNIGLPEALNQNLLFTRFRKIGSNTKSTGLGLAINKAIANKYDLELSYNFNDLHTFLIHFD